MLEFISLSTPSLYKNEVLIVRKAVVVNVREEETTFNVGGISNVFEFEREDCASYGIYSRYW